MSHSASHSQPSDAPQPSQLHDGQTPAEHAASDVKLAETTRDTDGSVLEWTSGDRQFALVVGGLIFALILLHWGRMAWRGAPAVEIHRIETAANRFQLDINSATWVEWMHLNGVGEALSRRIVDDREQNGPFESIDDVQRVRGIGPKTLEELRPWLHCADCPPDSATNDRNDT